VDAIDVKDVAALHIAAMLDPDTKNARLQTWGISTNWNDMLAILRKLRPGKEFLPDFPDHDYVEVTTDQSESIALLKKWANQDGWTSLEDTIADTISDPYFK
jgi:nucleoside-diphosphate-sugar epimerase